MELRMYCIERSRNICRNCKQRRRHLVQIFAYFVKQAVKHAGGVIGPTKRVIQLAQNSQITASPSLGSPLFIIGRLIYFLCVWHAELDCTGACTTLVILLIIWSNLWERTFAPLLPAFSYTVEMRHAWSAEQKRGFVLLITHRIGFANRCATIWTLW